MNVMYMYFKFLPEKYDTCDVYSNIYMPVVTKYQYNTMEILPVI